MDCINKHGEEDFFCYNASNFVARCFANNVCKKKNLTIVACLDKLLEKFDFFYYGKNRAHDDDDRKSIDKNGQPKLLDTLQGENIAKLLLSQHCRTQQQFYVLTIGFEFEGHQFAGR
ncbi:hypothetical protein T03_10320 [Trichinella britovi]|uniref:Uncharacterized protein n=1 Tax=Trichinella britovi TaxID=45882 RepID=A0A0V1CJ94_TRIBR|nr:hypothetical protein T03_10320 [Trichinella britovi]